LTSILNKKRLFLIWGGIAALILFLTLSATLIRLPMAIALRAAEIYPDYFSFEFDRDKWRENHSSLELILIDVLTKKLMRDWITQEIIFQLKPGTKSPYTHVGDAIQRIASSLQKSMLSQRYVDGDVLELDLPNRLILGWGYCNHINQILSYALAEIYGEASAWATRYPETGVSKQAAGKSTHSLVVINVNGVEVFADAWNSVHVFKIVDIKNVLTDIKVYDSMPTVAPQEEYGFQKQAKGLLIKQAYTNGSASTFDKDKIMNIGMFDFRMKPDVGFYLTKYQNDVEMLYLIGRIFYLYRFYEESRELLLAIAKTGCEDLIECKLARKYIEHSF
jgi:hypothetical protein